MNEGDWVVLSIHFAFDCHWIDIGAGVVTTPTQEQIEAAAQAMMRDMFAPHELPKDEWLQNRYRETAKDALTAAAEVGKIEQMQGRSEQQQGWPEQMQLATAGAAQSTKDDCNSTSGVGGWGGTAAAEVGRESMNQIALIPVVILR